MKLGQERGNLGRGPGLSPGLFLMRWHLCAARRCWGSPGKGPSVHSWVSPWPSPVQSPLPTLAPSQGTEAPGREAAHLHPQDRSVAGLGSASLDARAQPFLGHRLA